MADVNHVKRLTEVGSDWNAWRSANPGVRPDLREADLRGQTFIQCDLAAANLLGAKLEKTVFVKSKFCGAVLSQAHVSGSTFMECDLRGVVAHGLNARKSRFFQCQISEARFVEYDATNEGNKHRQVAITGYGVFSRPRCRASDFRYAEFTECSIDNVVLDYACLQGISAIKTSFISSSLVGADFSPSYAIEVTMRGANLASEI